MTSETVWLKRRTGDPECAFGELSELHRQPAGCPSCHRFWVDGVYKNCEWVHGVTKGTHEEATENTKRRVVWLRHKERFWGENNDFLRLICTAY